MNAFDLPVLNRIGRFAANWRALREDMRTERILNALPPEMRKDIGWPELYRRRRTRHR